MAEIEQVFRMNADFMHWLMEQQAKMLQEVIEKARRAATRSP